MRQLDSALVEVNRLISVEGVLTSSDFWEASRQSPDTDFRDLGNIKMVIKRRGGGEKKDIYISCACVFVFFFLIDICSIKHFQKHLYS